MAQLSGWHWEHQLTAKERVEVAKHDAALLRLELLYKGVGRARSRIVSRATHRARKHNDRRPPSAGF